MKAGEKTKRNNSSARKKKLEERKVVIVTGLSGAGKSSALAALEDWGYHCIDNLPPRFITESAESMLSSENEPKRLAFCVDIRCGKYLLEFPKALAQLKKANCPVEVLFLEAADEVLIRRYSTTKRIHPLAPKGSIIKGILRERKQLAELRRLATTILDTSDFNVYELRRRMTAMFAGGGKDELSITLLSFGFQNGLPPEADIVFDVRFLPNPFYNAQLRDLSGTDHEVREYVLSHYEAEEFIGRATELLQFLLPLYKKEGKRYVTIAVGCTGGRHRSVAVVRELATRLRNELSNIEVRDRDR